MQTENEKAVRDPMREAFELNYETDWDDPANEGLRSEWQLAWQAALQSQVSNTDGWVMVPVEPTDEMIDALQACETYCESCKGVTFSGYSGYKAMLSAAPKAPQQVSNTPQDAIGYVMENYAEFYAKHGQTVMTPEPESGRIPVYATPPQQQEQSGEAKKAIQAMQDMWDCLHKTGKFADFLMRHWSSQLSILERLCTPATPTATASQESAPGQEVVTVVGHPDVCESWTISKPLPTGTKLYLAPPTSTAIAAMVIKQAAECITSTFNEIKFKDNDTQLCVKAALGDALLKLKALTPAAAEAELEALMMKVAEEVHTVTMRTGGPVWDNDLRAIVRRLLDEKGE